MTKEKAQEVYIKRLENTIIDLLDGICDWQEIQRSTGLPEKDCKDILNLRSAINLQKGEI